MRLPRGAGALALPALLIVIASLPGCTRKGAAVAEPSLNVLVSALPESLDPYSDTRLLPRIVYENIFEPLVRHEPAGEPGHRTMLERWSNPSPSEWELHLRAGARFHDGSPVTAAEVVKSLDRARRPPSRVAGLLGDVDSVSSPADGVVRLKTRRPADLLKVLASVAIAREGPGGSWIGSGPFRPVGFDPGRSLLLSRFDGYFGGKPPIKEIQFHRFETGADVTRLLDRLGPSVVLDPPKEIVERARRNPKLAFAAEEKAALTYLAMSFPSGPPDEASTSRTRVPFADIRVRRAAQLAVDVPALLELTPAGGIPTGQIAPPGALGYDPGRSPTRRDLPAARELLREAGYESGLTVTLDAPASSTNESLARAIAANLGEAGIRVDVNLMPPEEFRRHIDGSSAFYLYTWIVDEDPAEELRDFFHTPDPANGFGLSNRTRYSNPAFDVMIEKAVSADAEERRVASLHDALYVLDEDLPWIPLFSPRTARIYPRWLRVHPHADGLLHFSEAEVLPSASR